MAKWRTRAFTPGLRWLCAAFCFLSACTNNAGLDYASLHVEARNAAGDLAVIDPADNCTTLPLLRGSRVRSYVSVEGGLQLRLDATRNSVTVRRVGDAHEVLREISVENLESGYSESLSVQDDAGQSYEVQLMSSCPRKSSSD